MKRRPKTRSSDDCQTVRVGAARLLIPAEFDGRLVSASDCPANCSEFVARSPESTIYHSPPYIGFARRENGAADMLVVRSQGTPVFGIPIHPDSRGGWISTGYSGALFPDSNRESVLRASVTAFQQLVNVNRGLGFRIEQSVQASGYATPGRTTLLAQLLWDDRNQQRPAYARILPVSTGLVNPGAGAPVVDGASLDNKLLAQYDGDIRNQIRQALRRGLSVQVRILDNNATHAAIVDAYRRYMPVQVESYARTGMTAHTLDYWVGLSEAVQRGGGTDVVVLVTDESGRDVAGVTCHAFRGRAIYWSGASTASGKSARANPLALHAAITVCASIGVTTFELGRFDASERSEKERAITHYKAQFRGQLLPVLNFVRPPQTPRGQWGALARSIRSGLGRIGAASRP